MEGIITGNNQLGKTSVFVVDRCLFSREGLKALLAGIDDIKYVGGADGSKDTLEDIKKSSPDVVLIAVNTYSPKQVGTCYEIVKGNPNTKLFCLLTEAARDVIDECMNAGANGAMVEQCSFEELTGAIRKVSGGEQYFDSNIASVLASNYADQLLYGSKQTEMLTDRERNIVRMTANGKSVIQIAEIIGKKNKTVHAARRMAMFKLGIGSIAELTKFAVKHGLASLD